MERLRAGAAVYNDREYRWAAATWGGEGSHGPSGSGSGSGSRPRPGTEPGTEAEIETETKTNDPSETGADTTATGSTQAVLAELATFAQSVSAARAGAWAAARGSTPGLSGLTLPTDTPATVALGPLEEYAAAVRSDPAVVERRRPPLLRVAGQVPRRGDLGLETTALAAAAMAGLRDEHEAIDPGLAYAREDAASETVSSPFVALVFDYIRDGSHRRLIAERLAQHAGRRRAKDEGVASLFDPPE